MSKNDFKLEKDMPLKDMIKGLEVRRGERHAEREERAAAGRPHGRWHGTGGEPGRTVAPAA